MRDTQKERQRPRQRERQAPCRELDVGLDPRTPGSCPEPKADAQMLSHPGILLPGILLISISFSSFAVILSHSFI